MKNSIQSTTNHIELDRVNSDLNNVLTSTGLPVVMVDRGLRIRRLTAASAKVLKIVPSDMGRPISDIRWDVDVPNLDDLIASVIATLAPKELEVQAKDGQRYSLQIRPHRTTDDKIDGAVIVLSDINEAKQTSERMEKAKLEKRTGPKRTCPYPSYKALLSLINS
jgi:two-component system, chemotaxis family, CheB/CheR fusion protein